MNPERINIKELTIEEPEKQEAFFDVEKEITQEDWAKIWETFEDKKKNKNWAGVFEMGANMKTVEPTTYLGIEAAGWKYMASKTFVADMDQEKYYETAINAAEMKVIDPLVELNLNKAVYAGLEKSLEEAGQGDWRYGFWTRFFYLAARVKILFPHNNIDVGKYVVGMRKANLEKELQEWQLGGSDLFSALANLKIAGYTPLFEKKDLDYERKALDGHRKTRIMQGGQPDRIGNWDGFIKTAANLKILAAEKVEVTDKGLELTMPKRIEVEGSSSIPEVRNF